MLEIHLMSSDARASVLDEAHGETSPLTRSMSKLGLQTRIEVETSPKVDLRETFMLCLRDTQSWCLPLAGLTDLARGRAEVLGA